MSFQLPEIAKAAERLMLEIEKAVRQFPRYHKYSVGAELRQQAMHITELTHRAWRERSRQLEWTRQLVWAIDSLKIRLQLCKQLQAFTSFAQFEMLARLAKHLGKQAGGWLRQQTSKHLNGQNEQRPQADAQRAEKLSTRATSPSWEVYAR